MDHRRILADHSGPRSDRADDVPLGVVGPSVPSGDIRHTLDVPVAPGIHAAVGSPDTDPKRTVDAAPVAVGADLGNPVVHHTTVPEGVVGSAGSPVDNRTVPSDTAVGVAEVAAVVAVDIPVGSLDSSVPVGVASHRPHLADSCPVDTQPDTGPKEAVAAVVVDFRLHIDHLEK